MSHKAVPFLLKAFYRKVNSNSKNRKENSVAFLNTVEYFTHVTNKKRKGKINENAVLSKRSKVNAVTSKSKNFKME